LTVVSLKQHVYLDALVGSDVCQATLKWRPHDVMT